MKKAAETVQTKPITTLNEFYKEFPEVKPIIDSVDKLYDVETVSFPHKEWDVTLIDARAPTIESSILEKKYKLHEVTDIEISSRLCEQVSLKHSSGLSFQFNAERLDYSYERDSISDMFDAYTMETVVLKAFGIAQLLEDLKKYNTSRAHKLDITYAESGFICFSISDLKGNSLIEAEISGKKCVMKDLRFKKNVMKAYENARKNGDMEQLKKLAQQMGFELKDKVGA